MAVTSRSNLKQYFQTGNQPTSTQFDDLIDSFVHINEGDDNNQIKDTIHISGSETYVSGSLMGTTTSTPQNETKHFHNIQPANMGDNPSDLITSSLSPISGELINLFDGSARTGSEDAVTFEGSELTIDFYHQGWENQMLGDGSITNGVFVYFKEN